MVAACKERLKRSEVRSRSNKGLCATLNEALEWCEGEFFSPIAPDDIMKKSKTKLQVDFLRDNPDCRAVYPHKPFGFGAIDQLKVAWRYFFSPQ
jgi:alpha-1,3-rhamnosyltransferase